MSTVKIARMYKCQFTTLSYRERYDALGLTPAAARVMTQMALDSDYFFPVPQRRVADLNRLCDAPWTSDPDAVDLMTMGEETEREHYVKEFGLQEVDSLLEHLFNEEA